MKKTFSLLLAIFFVMMAACGNIPSLPQEDGSLSHSASNAPSVHDLPADSFADQPSTSTPASGLPAQEMPESVEQQPDKSEDLPVTRQIIPAMILNEEEDSAALEEVDRNEWILFQSVDGKREAIVKQGWPRSYMTADYSVNGEFRKRMAFDETNIHYTFGSLGWAGNDFDHEFITWWDPVKPILFASCNYTDLTIRIDFEAESVDLIYELKHARFVALKESPDKQYTLRNASEDGGGDGFCCNIALLNNRTNELKYIATSAGGDSYGFIDNQSYYLLNYGYFGIHSVDSSIPEMTLNIALGDIEEEGITRNIYSCLHLPETDRLVMVYSEHPIDILQTPSGEQLFNSLIMLCNRQGEVLETFDTGWPFLHHKNYPSPNRIFRIRGDETRVAVERLDSMYVFDLKSKEMTPLENPYNSEIDWVDE